MARGAREDARPFDTHQDIVVATTERPHEPPLGAAGYDRQPLDQRSRIRREGRGPGEHGVADGRRNGGTAAGQDLGDEEGVASRDPVQLAGVEVDGDALGQPGHSLRAQRCERDPPHGRSGEATEQASQRVSWVNGVVADGEDQQGRQRRDAPGEVADHVERGVVGPVHVLDGHHGGTSHHRQHAGERVVTLRAVERGFDTRVGQRHVPERTERARGQQVVAAAHDHLDLSRGTVEERREHGGLAAAGLPGDEDHRTALSGEGVVQGIGELVQRLLPLEQPAGDRSKRTFDAQPSR